MRNVKEIHRLEDPEQQPLETVKFNTLEDSQRFAEYVFGKLHGKGVEYSNVTVLNSWRITPWLRDRLPNDLSKALRPVTEEDIERDAAIIDREWQLAFEEDDLP